MGVVSLAFAAELTWLAILREKGDEMKTYEVSRENVVGAARRAIAQVRRDGDQVSTSLVRELMRLARVHDEFAIGEWFIEGRCGCLIGSRHGEDFFFGGGSPGFDGLSNEELHVGTQFDKQLRQLTGHTYTSQGWEAVVQVTP